MKTVASCADCHYPIGISSPGEKIACPLCGIYNEAVSNRISQIAYDPASIAGLLGGAILGGIVGYSKPKVATTIYGAVIGGGLGLLVVRAIKGV